ncbi:hypothetical protein LZ30DRAFT_813764 [Colletotrichum cereale]|nr:hypothetical protein LZ30DRAFT_813764 [Colletotrichum cereale]
MRAERLATAGGGAMLVKKDPSIWPRSWQMAMTGGDDGGARLGNIDSNRACPPRTAQVLLRTQEGVSSNVFAGVFLSFLPPLSVLLERRMCFRIGLGERYGCPIQRPHPRLCVTLRTASYQPICLSGTQRSQLDLIYSQRLSMFPGLIMADTAAVCTVPSRPCDAGLASRAVLRGREKGQHER